MSNNKVTALIFDKSTFILSPHYESYVSFVEDEKIVFLGINKEKCEDDFTVEFTGQEKCHAPLLSDNKEYVLMARILEGDDQYKISFALFQKNSPIIEAEVILDAQDYFISYSKKFARVAHHISSIEEATKFETDFSVRYLKKLFANIINGNDAFWEKLHSSIDTATAPLNAAITIDITSALPLPMVVRKEKSSVVNFIKKLFTPPKNTP